MAICLNDGYLLEGYASVASKIDYTVTGLDGTTLKMLASGQLADSKATLYTAAGTDTIAGITLYNTHSIGVTVNLYINDGTSRKVLGIYLGAGYHALFNGVELAVYDEMGNEEVNQNALPHGSTHENAGDDEISVTGLSGLLTDDQHVLDTEVQAIKIDDLTAGDDNTDLDTSSTKHGLAPKAVVPAAGLLNVYGIANAETAITNKAIFDATSPSTQAFADAAAVGTAMAAARRDHKHAMMADPSSALVAKALYDAYTILMATTNDTPEAITIAAQQVVGRITGGAIKGLSVAELQTLLFSAALPENVNIELAEAPSADGKWTGIIETGVAGATLAFGDLVYLQTADYRWELASSDNATAGCNLKLGICILAAANDGSATKVLLYGKVRADTAFPDLTLGAPVYMGITAGDIQVAAPTGTTDVVRKVGYGDEQKDTLFFCPSTDYLELA